MNVNLTNVSLMLTKASQEIFSLADWDFEIFQDEEGNYSFHGATVCDYFEIKNPSVAVQRHVDEEWRFKAPIELGKGSDAWMIKEPGLYQLAMVAKTPLAKKFQKWVYGDVLPKLRSQGIYVAPIDGESLADYKEREQHLIAENTKLTENLGKATRELKYWGVEFGEPRKPNLQNMRYQQVYSELQDMCPRSIWVAAHKKVVRMIPELTSVIPQSMLK